MCWLYQRPLSIHAQVRSLRNGLDANMGLSAERGRACIPCRYYTTDLDQDRCPKCGLPMIFVREI